MRTINLKAYGVDLGQTHNTAGHTQITIRGETPGGKIVQVVLDACCEHTLRRASIDLRNHFRKLKVLRDRYNRDNLEIYDGDVE